MVFDIGGGTSEVAVLSLGGIVYAARQELVVMFLMNQLLVI
ncbi:MAG: hypothetical protein Ct9H90mP22_6690 [Gammaproteobacteria bacterium]|nr:MAG: hypothetical protein Ct9H90mP22_6690 [Gammaproteobacteria bacterium]